MPRVLTPASLTILLCLSAAATPSTAESFLERMARQAAETAARKATDKIMNGDVSDAAKPKKAEDDPQVGQVLKPKPRAANASAPAPAPPPIAAAPPKTQISAPGKIVISADIKAQKEAFDEFGRVSCNDCEGGRSYDSWAQRFFGGELAGEYNGWAKKLGNLKVGDRLTWRGQQSRGSLTVISETPVDGFRCKQITYRLDKGSTQAERPGLVCWGKLNEYAASDSWVEVY